MQDVLVFATVVFPIVMAVTELFKRSINMPKSFVPLLAVFIGLFIGFAGSIFTDLDVVYRLWAGGLSGLAATGLFELVTTSKGDTKE